LVKHLDNTTDEDIVGLNIPTGIPLVYDLDSNLRVRCHYYLSKERAITKATEYAAGQLSEKTETQ
jgi:2,3-bisphosphoglycerate-dependent phosphoglycerate mutase